MVRLTEVSCEDIKVSSRARILRDEGGGYVVDVANQFGRERLRDGSGDAVFTKRADAVRTLQRHNPTIEIQKKRVLPSPSLQSPAELYIEEQN